MGTQVTAKPSKKKINITDQITQLIEIIIQETSIFKHIDVNRILVCVSSNRKNSRGSTYGKLVPLKFKNGESILKYKGKYYTIPKLVHNGIPLLYVIYFYIPRFFDLSSFEKLRVIFHELYHISKEFNGDIRRMGEVKKAHGFSTKRFNSLFDDELQRFHEFISTTSYIDYLDMGAKTIWGNYHKVYCRRLKMPKPVILEKN